MVARKTQRRLEKYIFLLRAPLILIIKVFRIFFKRKGFIVLSNNNKEGSNYHNLYHKDLDSIPKRGPIPDLPNLKVTVGESPKLAKEIAKLRLKSASISKLFRDVLEEQSDD